MNEVIVLSPNPGQPWWILVFPALLLVGGIVMAIIASASWYDEESAGAFFAGGFMLALIIGAIMSFTMINADHQDTVDRKLYALREIGYSQIEVGDPYTAVKDGEYVRLTLEPVPNEERTYQVIEIPPVP